jgi:hypothetical protein
MQELDFGVVDDTIKINNPSAVTTHCDGDINLLSFMSKHVKSTVHTTSDDHDTAKDLTSSEEQVQEAPKASKEVHRCFLHLKTPHSIFICTRACSC